MTTVRPPHVVVAAALALSAGACVTGAGGQGAGAAVSDLGQVARLEQERAPAVQLAAFATADDPAVARRAVLALARLERRDATAPLVTALSSADAGVRATAAFGLGQLDLALDDKLDAHKADRGRAEQALLAALAAEADPEVRRAVVRALGRVADQAGLDALIRVAAADGPLRAEALTALGVSGARRKASRGTDAALLAAIAAGLASTDDAVRAGAAYALFRQKATAPLDALATAWNSKDAQVRIFLARAASSQEPAVAARLVELGLADPDWRVRIEAVREAVRSAGSKNGEVAGLARALETALAEVGEGTPAAHVAREACLALAASAAAPAELAPRLRAAAAALAAKGPPLKAVACACAAALDAVEPEEGALARCGARGTELARFDVLRVARARVSAKERAHVLAQQLTSTDLKVRMSAAAALIDDGSEAALEAAAAALAGETDVGVISTLLEPFAEPGASEPFSDATLFALVERLRPATTFEGAEPLVSLARIARGRDSPTAAAVVATLKEHTEPRVRDAAAGVAAGDRAPGPRASVIAAPSVDELPAQAELVTSRGTVTIAFARELAPATVANFVALARAKVYDGTPFHRVIADFVSQGGDHARGDGAGGPGYTVACENSDAPYLRGAVGMAHAGKDTGGSQFFLTHSWQPHLDGRYTLFANVTSGLEVMDALQPDDVLVRVVLP
ncbi:MAG: peptidylprolyl isomerase [Deltaproteobacteria bacterium]|nr:peptidylprolyl isomerase [Deltaproteobacteria bacterium]